MDYEKILESLKICSEVGTSCEGCSGRGERHCIANLTKAAAIAIETLLHALDMAQRERDIVTKRMIELEQETVTNRNGLNEQMTNAQKIRSMTDEDIAWELMLWRCEAVARHHGISSEYPDTQKTILEWLQQPADEADHDA